ncbi:alkyl hydroperoxide reductase [Halomicronema hongdechloris C2206]|uniref:thioredoxin-dependent peroxiredoxin n=1 Tax=Halomicronema hongdechloris C2206 TaxID=1641165 RepID=A0A1Z3HM81_9CYAN|nr:peroxiredoxin-like family protein [Halomicronema hongdechloris]ASC71400.1 alkyl hydroperoxide reductase [Halomicronema hongdechloris C2206]
MSLTQDLADLAQQTAAKLPGEVQAKMAAAAEELANSGITDDSLKQGDRIPDVTLPNATGREVAIGELLKSGPVVISFYRGGWCPYCNLELRALQQALPEIQAQGASLVAISPQTPDNSLSTAQKHEFSFEVLSDVGNRVARQFGLVFTVPAALRSVYQSLGIDLPAYNGDNSFELPLPATYVVNTDGTIAHAFVNSDYKQRQDPDEIVAVLKQLPVVIR